VSVGYVFGVGVMVEKLENDKALKAIIGKRVVWAGFVICPGLGYCDVWGDHDHILIVFDDGSSLLLSSEDYEAYASWIEANLYSEKHLRELTTRLNVEVKS